MPDVPVWQCDHASATAQVISPELPCGAAWLANCLLELNVAVFQPWGICLQDEWARLAPNTYQYTDAQHHWRQTLPAYRCHRVFKFIPHTRVDFAHQWPEHGSHNGALIFMVRDPRDMLYSAWRRQHAHGACNSPFSVWLDETDPRHGITPLRYLQQFLRHSVARLQQQPHCLVRFEDYKKDPRTTLLKVLGHLNIETDPQQLAHALECSSFKAIKAQETRLLQEGRARHTFHFKGQSNEHLHSMSPQLSQRILAALQDSVAWLDYPAWVAPMDVTVQAKLTGALP